MFICLFVYIFKQRLLNKQIHIIADATTFSKQNADFLSKHVTSKWSPMSCVFYFFWHHYVLCIKFSLRSMCYFFLLASTTTTTATTIFIIFFAGIRNLAELPSEVWSLSRQSFSWDFSSKCSKYIFSRIFENDCLIKGIFLALFKRFPGSKSKFNVNLVQNQL